MWIKRRGLITKLKQGPVAQLAEPPAHNRLVPGSSPGGPILKGGGYKSGINAKLSPSNPGY